MVCVDVSFGWDFGAWVYTLLMVLMVTLFWCSVQCSHNSLLWRAWQMQNRIRLSFLVVVFSGICVGVYGFVTCLGWICLDFFLFRYFFYGSNSSTVVSVESCWTSFCLVTSSMEAELLRALGQFNAVSVQVACHYSGDTSSHIRSCVCQCGEAFPKNVHPYRRTIIFDLIWVWNQFECPGLLLWTSLVQLTPVEFFLYVWAAGSPLFLQGQFNV